jgi:enoyl-CoA hydratase/carnithine racemase
MRVTLPDACAVLGAYARVWGDSGGEVRFDTTPWGLELVIARPEAANAMSVAQLRRLGEAVQWAMAQPDAVAVLRAEGPVFCAGGDLREVTDHWLKPDAARAVAAAATAVLDALSRLPQVLIVAVDGPAVGGGLELAACADHLVAGSDARFEPRQVALGVACGWGGAARWVSRLGPSRAMGWMLDGSSLDGPAALALGLVDEVDACAGSAALARAVRWAGRDRAAVRAWVAQVRASQPPLVPEALEAFLGVWGGEGHRAALAARRRR